MEANARRYSLRDLKTFQIAKPLHMEIEQAFGAAPARAILLLKEPRQDPSGPPLACHPQPTGSRRFRPIVPVGTSPVVASR